MNETPPPRYCSRHPHGSAGACRLCDHAAAGYATWLQSRARAALAVPEAPRAVTERRATESRTQRRDVAALLHLVGVPDPEGSHRGYLAATAELARCRGGQAPGAPRRPLAPPGAVCLDCGRPAPLAHLTVTDGDVKCAECWAGETARARAITKAIEARADGYA
jgi:hypothetical protein